MKLYKNFIRNSLISTYLYLKSIFEKIKLLFILGTFFPAQAGGPDSSIYWLNKAFLNLNTSVNV